MSGPLWLRCSGLPLALLCPGSVRPEGLRVDSSHPAAAVGTAAHEGLARLVETGRIDWGATGELAARHGVDEGELRYLLAQGQRLWAEICDGFPQAQAEVELRHEEEDLELTGHADVLALTGTTIRIADWKSARLDHSHAEQLRGYCALALLAHPWAELAEAYVLWLRDGEAESYSMDRAQLERWLEALRAQVVDWDGTYRVGEHCQFCHRSHECPAGRALVRRDVAAIADDALLARVEDADALAALAPEQIVEVLGKADLVYRYAERVRRAIREHVQRNGDVVGGGKRLTLQQEERRSLDPMAAWPVLDEALSEEELAQIITLNVSEAERLVAKKAPKRKGAAAVRELRARLDEAGAIKISTITKLVVRRAEGEGNQ